VSVSWVEAIHLTGMLMRDSRSWLQAGVNRWAFPVSAEWQLAAQHFDVFVASQSKKKQKPLKRPWPMNETRIGKTADRSPGEVRARLEAMNQRG
jgi:hypothetical protein